MSKNIVICCDGTGNKLDVCKSNVVRLFSILRRDDPAPQVALYDPGVDTMAPAAALTSASRLATKLAGGAVGFGLLDNVAEMYGFLMEHFDEGDRVFLFGFSRRAFPRGVPIPPPLPTAAWINKPLAAPALAVPEALLRAQAQRDRPQEQVEHSLRCRHQVGRQFRIEFL
jgi:hypothetical protein